MPRYRHLNVLIGSAALCVLLALAAVGLVTEWGSPRVDATLAAPTTGAEGQTMDTVSLVEAVEPAVVTVINQQQVGGLRSGAQAQPAGSGTGFIIDDRGHVVTNEHVVRNGDSFEVIFADGEERPATLVGADPLSDLAVVRVEGDVPATVPLGDSDALRQGQPVVAIGSPLGAFANTVTDGIVSATNRDFPGVPNQGEAYYSNLVQHTAPINPGNSGGPLFNLAGQVVGVNTLGIPEAQGLFFAIPTNSVQRIVGQLIERGRVAYAYLGVSVQPVTEQLVGQYDLPVDHGVAVLGVEPNGPAAEAGIREGDFILALEGRQIDEQNPLSELLFASAPGDTIAATVQRGDQRLEIPVTLAEREES